MRISDWGSDVCSSDLGRRRRLDVADGNARRGFRHALPGRGVELLAVADHMVDLRHGGEGGGIDLGGTAGNDDAGTGTFAAQAADCLPGPIGRASCRARVWKYV